MIIAPIPGIKLLQLRVKMMEPYLGRDKAVLVEKFFLYFLDLFRREFPFQDCFFVNLKVIRIAIQVSYTGIHGCLL
jgi:hypothetical protein